MADVIIAPGQLTGDVVVPASKSMCHRAVICAGLAKGKSHIAGITLSEDIAVSIQGMQALGATIRRAGSELLVEGSGGVQLGETTIDCGESGSTLRFLIPLALLGSQPVRFTGRGRLVERPLSEYAGLCREQGLLWESSGGLPLRLCGPLRSGRFSLRGDVSSQFLSGLLFALPLLEGDSVIELTSGLESRGYVDLTLSALADFGIKVSHKDYREFHTAGGQAYQARDYRVEGDFSQAAFWLVAGTIGQTVTCGGLSTQSLQGDKVILDLITRAGGSIRSSGSALAALPANTVGTVIDAVDCPDLVPVLAVLASVSNGETRIIRAGRLRLKESDRLAAITSELGKLGADIREDGDSLIIYGKPWLSGGEVDSWHDHRIAMALAVASIRCRQPVIIRGAECVNKSYPDFWRDFAMLGGAINGCGLGQ